MLKTCDSCRLRARGYYTSRRKRKQGEVDKREAGGDALIGLSAATAGAASVLLTDYDEEVLGFARQVSELTHSLTQAELHGASTPRASTRRAWGRVRRLAPAPA